MQVTVQNENTVVVDVQQQETIVVEVDQGRAGRGIENITYQQQGQYYYLVVTYTDGTTETLGPLVITGAAVSLLGGTAGAIAYQTAPDTTGFLTLGTQNQVVVAGATAPQYTSALTGLTVNNSAIGNTAPSTGAFTNLSASGTFALTGDQVQISEGGTGQTTANDAFNALAPSQTGNAGKYLKTDGTNSSWDQLDISTADITGTLPIANGGTGQTTANSALNALLPTQAAQSGKYLKTDGTNASWDQLDISTADITGVLPIANGGTGASTAAGARANLSAAILGTNNDITSLTGITGGISTPDFVQFDTTATEANAVGKVYWDAAQGTLDLGLLGGNVITRIGQSLVAYVTNAEAVTITKGQAVYLFGAQGNRASVKLASNLSDATSAKTFGVVAENIPANGTGFIMCQGVLEGLNLGAYTAGDTLYLGATPGSLTATKPYAPNHLVYVGLVERANAGNGQLYVKVQNGYELDEIHDVQIINPQNGQTILYDASTSLWKNANLTAGTGISVTNGAASVTIGNTGVLSFSGGTTGLTPATSTTGAVTLGGTLAVASGGTGATTAGGALTNLGAASSAITISAGTGLTGGGDLTANRTLSIANTTVTAASYGSASSVGTFTVNAQGQLTAAASTPIAIANTQVSGLGTMSTQNSNSVTITGGSITGITDLAIADGGTGASDAPTARTNLGLGTSATLNAGVALGVATLDAGGTVPLSQLPASIQGGVSYQGSWDAATNTPTIVSSVGTKGYYYVVSVAGSTNINGISDWLPGDWIIFNGSIWQKIDNTDAVASVNGYTGVVVLNAADVGAPPTSRTITAGTGLTGGGDLSANRTISIANTTVAAGSYGSASSVGTFTVNGQGQLTAAASTPIAITNTQVSGLGTMSTQNAGSVAITGGTIDGTTIGGTTRAAGSFTTLTLTNALSVANGGTGTTTSTGTGSVVLSSSPTLTTPNLGTPSAVTLTNATGLPLTTGVTGTLPIGNGGTGQTTANAAFNALAPSQTGNAGKYLTTDGTNTSWATNPLGTVTSVDVSGGTTGLTTSGGPITSSGTITLGGTLATTNGGTGLTSFTANRVFYASSTSAIGQSANLTFDGTTLTAANFADSSLTSGRVTYAGTGGNLTDSAALTFNGNWLTATNAATNFSELSIQARFSGAFSPVGLGQGADGTAYLVNIHNSSLAFGMNNSASMYLTSTGLGIGTISPSYRLDVSSASTPVARFTGASNAYVDFSDGTVTSRLQNSGALLFGTTSNHSLLLRTNSTTQATLDTSGNFGLGVTPSAWTTYSVLELGKNGGGYIGNTQSGGFIGIGNNFYFNGSYRYANNAAATFYYQQGGNHYWQNAGGAAAGSAFTFTTPMTLDASGRLLIGYTTSQASGSNLQVNTDAYIYGITVGRGAGAVATNTAVGASALAANTTGSSTVALGDRALNANTTGDEQIAVGAAALFLNTTGSFNHAFGRGALRSNTTGNNNTGVGYYALFFNTTASNNTAVGFQAGFSNTTGDVTAFGRLAMRDNTTGVGSTAVGLNSLLSNTTGNNNTVVGYSALASNTTASNNTAVGFQAAFSNTTGAGNVAIGNLALYSDTTGGSHTAVGSAALRYSTGDYNTALGENAGRGTNGSFTGSGNLTVGPNTGLVLTTGNNNTFVGGVNSNNYLNAGAATTTGAFNAFIGGGAGASNTTGSNNVSLGWQALFSNTTASYNTAVGYQASYSNTTGIGLVAMGYQAGYSNTTGISNSSYGNQALKATTTGSNNTAIGQEALALNTTASDNTAVGYQAGYNNTTGANNVFVGNQTGFSITTGFRNTFIGGNNGNAAYGAGGYITTGSRNTIIGCYNGNQGGLDIRTASNYIVLSDGDGNPLISTNSTRSVALNGAVPQTGTGITFPATQVASSDANTLDDYEEGGWTPTITYTTPGSLSVTYNTQSGVYTKIGNLVTLSFAIRLASFSKGTASGELRVGGVPFAQSFDTAIGTVGLYASPFSSQPILVPGSTFFNLLRLVNNGAWVSLDDPDADSQYFGSITIRV